MFCQCEEPLVVFLDFISRIFDIKFRNFSFKNTGFFFKISDHTGKTIVRDFTFCVITSACGWQDAMI